MSLTASDGDDGSRQEVQVLEFDLDEQRYCVAIEHVAEIVDETALTAVPDSPSHVLGVMNLREETTTIVDPTVIFGLESTSADGRIVIFDDDADRQSGWRVDAVDRVSTIDPSDAQEQTDAEAIQGVVNRDDGFLLWIDPTAINQE